jgi:hypothetical protein
MKRANYGLIGAFGGLLIVYLAQSSRMLPARGLGPTLILAPLIGAIIGTIIERIRHRIA